MKHVLSTAFILSFLAACAPPPPERGAGFDGPKQLTQPRAVAMASAPTVPQHAVAAPRRNDLRKAAWAAKSAGGTFWKGPESERVALGKFKFDVRLARVGTQTFFVAEHRSNIIGATRFNLFPKVVAMAEQKSGCRATDGYFRGQQGYEHFVVVPLDC